MEIQSLMTRVDPYGAQCSGAKTDQDGEADEDDSSPAPSFLIDALTGTAALLVIMALARRVPLMR